MDNNMKEVDFKKYCKSCKHEKVKESEDPCWDCLEVPARPDSHKPERWEKGKGKEK